MSTTKLAGALASVVAGLALLAPADADAIALDLLADTAGATVAAGGSFTVTGRISGLGDGAAPSLSAFDIDLGFDPAQFALGTWTFGTGLGFSLQSDLAGAGTLNLAEVSLESAADLDLLQPASFALFTVSFTALADAVADVRVAAFDLADGNGALFRDVAVGGTLQTVPEPASASLLALALLGGGAVLRRRRARTIGG